MADRLNKKERMSIPLGEVIKGRAIAMFPDNPDLADVWERGASWMCDLILDDACDKILKIEKAQDEKNN
jgi:hypothetical protein